MGKLIYFKKKNETGKKMNKLWIKIAGGITLTASICTILGVTVKDLINELTDKNDTIEEAVAQETTTQEESVIQEENVVQGEIVITEGTSTNQEDSVSANAGENWQDIAEQYNNDGLTLYNAGEYEQAIELYNMAIELESKGIEDIDVCYYNRGMAYCKLGDYQQAILDYTKALEIAEKSKYYSARSNAYAQMGDSDNSVKDAFSAVGLTVQ